MLTAPTPESDRSNLLALLQRREKEGGQGEGVFLVHRLDLLTSGLVVFARTEDAMKVLSESFRTHDLERAGTWRWWPGLPRPHHLGRPADRKAPGAHAHRRC